MILAGSLLFVVAIPSKGVQPGPSQRVPECQCQNIPVLCNGQCQKILSRSANHGLGLNEQFELKLLCVLRRIEPGLQPECYVHSDFLKGRPLAFNCQVITLVPFRNVGSVDLH